MITISDEQFGEIIEAAVASLPKQFAHVDNVAIVVEDEPSEQQRRQLKLQCNQTLFGLYEGVALSRRQGTHKMLPDKITLFKKPLEASVQKLDELRRAVRHTLWHEIGHYYGLDHARIHELEKSN